MYDELPEGQGTTSGMGSNLGSGRSTAARISGITEGWSRTAWSHQQHWGVWLALVTLADHTSHFDSTTHLNQAADCMGEMPATLDIKRAVQVACSSRPGPAGADSRLSGNSRRAAVKGPE